MEALANLLEGERVDIALLQEVTPQTYTALLKQPAVQMNFMCSSLEKERQKSTYKTCILCRISTAPAINMFLCDLPATGRMAITSYWRTKDTEHKIGIGCVHLQSESDAVAARKAQFIHTDKCLRVSGCAATLIAGDFNFADSAEDSLFNETGYTDIFTRLHKEEKGFTYDIKLNPNVESQSQSSRLDRICIHNSSKYLVPETIEITGNTPTPGLATVFISDHFAVLTQFLC